VAVPDEWSAVLALHCSFLSACLAGIVCDVCLHVLQAHDGPDVSRLENVCACISNRSARYFIMLKAHSPQGTVGHVTALEAISTER
jgi:hypothetical protein